MQLEPILTLGRTVRYNKFACLAKAFVVFGLPDLQESQRDKGNTCSESFLKPVSRAIGVAGTVKAISLYKK
jgi:hypothetical protein